MMVVSQSEHLVLDMQDQFLFEIVFFAQTKNIFVSLQGFSIRSGGDGGLKREFDDFLDLCALCAVFDVALAERHDILEIESRHFIFCN